jgi:hypothetical protein
LQLPDLRLRRKWAHFSVRRKIAPPKAFASAEAAHFFAAAKKGPLFASHFLPFWQKSAPFLHQQKLGGKKRAGFSPQSFTTAALA